MMCDYLELIRRIDPEVRSTFVNLTKTEFTEWDETMFNILNELVGSKYKDNKLNKALRVLLFSQPCIWLLFINDEDFLVYLDGIWPSIIELIKNEVDAVKNFIDVIAILHRKYEKRFPIE